MFGDPNLPGLLPGRKVGERCRHEVVVTSLAIAGSIG
jgi:hypothetical protein